MASVVTTTLVTTMMTAEGYKPPRFITAILQTGDIYRIFLELQHSLARLQHRYYDVTILMG